MAQRPDFRDEETTLQHLGRALGVAVDGTPTFHAELAGEGIEYSWGYAKQLYRRKACYFQEASAKLQSLGLALY
jgi:hypothetical protein